MAPILLIDSHSLLYRAHYALPPMNTQAGHPTSALYGFSTLLLKLLREHQPAGVSFARDLPQPGFRKNLDANYKAGRARTPSDLQLQLREFHHLPEALGCPMLSAAGFEADDVLATVAKHLSNEGRKVIIVSGDRDLFQAVNENCNVLFIGRRGKDHVMYDEAAVTKRFDLSPGQLATYIALVGDTSDAIEGIEGVGPKTAAKWIQAHGTIDGILAATDVIKPKRFQDALQNASERLRTNERLATLQFDVSLPAGPWFSAFDKAARTRLREWFTRWEFNSLVSRLEALP